MKDTAHEIRVLAAELARDSIVTHALGRLIEQIVCEAAVYMQEKERNRIADILDGYTVPIDATKLAKAIRNNFK